MARAVKIVLEKCERTALRSSSIDSLLTKDREIRDFFWNICNKYNSTADPSSTVDASTREFGSYVKLPAALALKALSTSDPLIMIVSARFDQLAKKVTNSQKDFQKLVERNS